MAYPKLQFALFLGIVFLISGCQFIKPIEVSQIKSFKIGESKGFGVSLTVGIELKNPNSRPLRLSNANLMVWIDDKELGKLIVPDEILLPSNESLMVECKMDIPLTVLLSTGKGILKRIQSGTLPVVLKGTLDARYFIFKKQVKLNASHVVEF